MAIVLAYASAAFIRTRSPIFSAEPRPGPYASLRNQMYAARLLLFPLLLIVALAFSVDLSGLLFQQSQLVRISQSVAVVFMLYSLINHFVRNKLVRRLIVWILIPASILHIFDLLESVVAYLDTIALEVGNVKISAYGVLRMLIFGSLLFWLGRVSRTAGQRIIRKQEELDVGTREVFAKLFEVVLVIVIFILLLQVLGINLTTLAVFGGALGVGLGFGLQSIASNFISGIILLLDRSFTVGDYIELEDGRAGVIRELNMRSATLETFDGKDIMVPNERFMTGTFVNWTHKNKKQRYSLELQVAYSTDLDMLFPLLRQVVAEHPQVLSGDSVPIEERPDAEIKQFGESGIDILIEFWMEGVDDGSNRVGADLLLMIWYALKEHHVEIPFPQREVTILGKTQ
ncbi:mechanosensitive ion channel protein [Motiliproteus coralliicola]|uniref:Mechanosensitive ion channel protein n=2 Tax=Motiliproteus coralliicola TaxID=2283196 RepID=A0A369WXU5_9GAMM|nr:mechanosensitive ion channel protein [Motiliproteus coralliicola]